MAVSPIDTDLADFGDILSQELATAIRSNIDALYGHFPIGEIAAIVGGIPGLNPPNPDIWQVCNGSEITNPASPLKSVPGQQRFTPNLTDRFIRFPAANISEVNTTGGINERNFEHDHQGFTEYSISPEGADRTTDGLQNTSQQHRHKISPALTQNFNLEPPYFVLKFYMKIQ